MVRLFQLVWASPGSVLGLLLAPFFDRRRIHGGVLVCEGARWPRRLGWRYRAITLGHVVLCVDDTDERIFRHEMAHVGQWARWGPFFLPAYVVATLTALVRGKHPYRDNAFEVGARRSEG